MAKTNQALLEIVLTNVLRNAFQYTHEGEVKIASNETQLIVTDTGFGIPAQELDKINQPFFSLQPDGLGLGMSIVQRIVWQLGWQLNIESESGKGTRVILNVL